jgi:hypothetical protein
MGYHLMDTQELEYLIGLIDIMLIDDVDFSQEGK